MGEAMVKRIAVTLALALAASPAFAATYAVVNGAGAIENYPVEWDQTTLPAPWTAAKGSPMPCGVPNCSLVAQSNLTAAQLAAWSAPALLTPAQQAEAAIAAGLAIVSTSTPSLNGTFAIDGAAVQNIGGIYSGIKDGDGLPGGGTSFNYPDLSGAMHSFTGTTFPPFAKAVRDYLYALSQGQAPAQPVPIP